MKVSSKVFGFCLLVALATTPGCTKSDLDSDIRLDVTDTDAATDIATSADVDAALDAADDKGPKDLDFTDEFKDVDGQDTPDLIEMEVWCPKGKDCQEMCPQDWLMCDGGGCVPECCNINDCTQIEGSLVICSNAGTCEIKLPCDGLCGQDKPVCIFVEPRERCVQCHIDSDCTGINPLCRCSEDEDWTCVLPYGSVCTPDAVQCSYPDDLPEAHGPAAVANYIHMPENNEEKVGCYDYTGEGTPDSGLNPQGINARFDDMVSAGKVAVILEFKGVTDAHDNPGFTLYGITGTPLTTLEAGADVYVDTEDYLFNQDFCEPLVKMNAKIVDNVLSGGADKVRFKIYIAPELTLNVDLIDVHVTADVSWSETGIQTSNGVIAAVLTMTELSQMRDALDEACQLEPQPEELEDICPFLYVATMTGPNFDLHRNEDGTYVPKTSYATGNAWSICIKFSLLPVNLIGYRPI